MQLRNRSTEKDIRDWLDKSGYVGQSAKFDHVELAAVQPPGWVQVFEFAVRVSDDADERHEFYGVARDDERVGIEVFLGRTTEEQTEQLAVWSKGLIARGKRKKPSSVVSVLLAFFLVLLLLCCLAAFTSR